MSLPANAKKKGTKKKRLSQAEREKRALDASATTLRQTRVKFTQFVDRLDDWLLENHQHVLEMFSSFDSDNIRILTYAQFKAGMRDLKVPCNETELHLLCQLLDREHCETIQYGRLENGMAFVRLNEEQFRIEDIRPSLILTTPQRQMPHCSQGGCKMSKWDGESFRITYPRYLNIRFQLLSLEHFPNHPGHFTKLIPSHLTVFHLEKFIRDQTGLQSTDLRIFSDRSAEARFLLSPELTLEDCSFMGGTKNAPKDITLYYDYVPQFTDCPLLLCDHYFGRKVKTTGTHVESTKFK